MERSNHQADDQQPGAALLRLLQQLRHRHHRLHSGDSADYGASDDQAEPPDEGHELPFSKAQGDPGEVQRRPTASVPGDHEDLQGARSEPSGLPGAHVHSAPHLDRPLSGNNPDSAYDPREAIGPGEAPVLRSSAGTRSCPAGQQFPVAEPGGARPFAYRLADPGRGVDVADAEDDHYAGDQRDPGVHEQDDAVDDAGDVRIFHPELPQRTGTLLDRFQRNRGNDTGPDYRLGATGEVHTPGPRTRSGRGQRASVHGAGGRSTCRR